MECIFRQIAQEIATNTKQFDEKDCQKSLKESETGLK